MPKPKLMYQQIYDYTLNEIHIGHYNKGDYLPTEKEFGDQFNVSRITVKTAMNMLSEKGYITRIRGKGSFVGKAESPSLLKSTPIATPTKLIGLCSSAFGDEYGIETLVSAMKTAEENSYFLVPTNIMDNQDVESEKISALIKLGVDGIIIMPVNGEHYNSRILELILSEYPIVFFDRYLKGLDAPFVGTDNLMASKMGTDYLLNLGHRHIGFISPPLIDTSSLEDRLEGFINSHAKQGVLCDPTLMVNDILNMHPVISTESKISENINKVTSFLKNNPKVTAILAAEQSIAVIILKVATSLGIKVPEDLSILCFDTQSNYLKDTFFTYIKQPESIIGKISVELLLEKIKDPKTPNRRILLIPELVIGRSTAKVKIKTLKK
ncbi:GntR family transcriptional regulator [Clostridium lacusfryxellense]|uniref:GntR family transcriptional regulator n=1 Tax=Clostridium lacusfryxellense TaxID=205328 RepID=UPI001C0B469D|nr:GntR family transcriptional regulator [Clostridium lacusfryxellense]MBU3113833.1 GntR family transcriptional regulator [Clostridium lacusfryxellense]